MSPQQRNARGGAGGRDMGVEGKIEEGEEHRVKLRPDGDG